MLIGALPFMHWLRLSFNFRLQKAYQHSKNSDEILADEVAGSKDDTFRSDELLERIKYQQELVDLERKVTIWRSMS